VLATCQFLHGLFIQNEKLQVIKETNREEKHRRDKEGHMAGHCR